MSLFGRGFSPLTGEKEPEQPKNVFTSRIQNKAFSSFGDEKHPGGNRKLDVMPASTVMECKRISLSAKGLRQAAVLCDQSEFTFVVGNDKKEFSCTKLQACFVSRKVRNALSLDPTLDRFPVSPDGTCSHFHLIEGLWNGDTVDVNEHNIDELTILCLELGNDELIELLADYPSISRKERNAFEYKQGNRVHCFQFLRV